MRRFFDSPYSFPIVFGFVFLLFGFVFLIMNPAEDTGPYASLKEPYNPMVGATVSWIFSAIMFLIGIAGLISDCYHYERKNK